MRKTFSFRIRWLDGGRDRRRRSRLVSHPALDATRAARLTRLSERNRAALANLHVAAQAISDDDAEYAEACMGGGSPPAPLGRVLVRGRRPRTVFSPPADAAHRDPKSLKLALE